MRTSTCVSVCLCLTEGTRCIDGRANNKQYTPSQTSHRIEPLNRRVYQNILYLLTSRSSIECGRRIFNYYSSKTVSVYLMTLCVIRRNRHFSTSNSFDRPKAIWALMAKLNAKIEMVLDWLTFGWLLQMLFWFQTAWWMLLWLVWCDDGKWLWCWWLLLLLLLWLWMWLLCWWCWRWWLPAPLLIVPLPMCNICACPFRLFVIVCCCSVEPMAAARAVSSPVVLVVHIDIIHKLRDNSFWFCFFVSILSQ